MRSQTVADMIPYGASEEAPVFRQASKVGGSGHDKTWCIVAKCHKAAQPLHSCDRRLSRRVSGAVGTPSPRQK